MTRCQEIRWYLVDSAGEKKITRAAVVAALVREFIITPAHALQQIEANEREMLHFQLGDICRLEPRRESAEPSTQEVSL